MSGWVVPENPLLSPGLLTRRAASPLRTPASSIAWRGFDYGRGALRAGAYMLGLREGDNVLMPSLICDVVAAAFSGIGVDVRYYAVGERLEVDYEAADRLVDRHTKAFLGVHFFGFPQPTAPMRRFCDERGLWMIEDNAHGLLSEVDGQPLGGVGDIGIASVRKVLPIPTGAALFVNSPSSAADLDTYEISAGGRRTVRLIRDFVIRTVVRNVEATTTRPFVYRAKTSARAARPPLDSSATRTIAPDQLVPWWSASRRLATHIDLEALSDQRRGRYEWWLQRLARDRGAPRPIYAALRPGVVPFALPIEVDSPAAWHWVTSMRARGVEIFPWPELPRRSPEKRWRDRLLAIPLTADVAEADRSTRRRLAA